MIRSLSLILVACAALGACGRKPAPAPQTLQQTPPASGDPPASGAPAASSSEPDLGPALALVRGLNASAAAPTPSKPDQDPWFTAELAAALKADSHPGEVGQIDFDYRYGAQDVSITHLAFSAAPAAYGARVVSRFDNLGKPYEVDYDLRQTARGWRIGDISAPPQGGDGAWDLRRLLKLKPMDASGAA